MLLSCTNLVCAICFFYRRRLPLIHVSYDIPWLSTMSRQVFVTRFRNFRPTKRIYSNINFMWQMRVKTTTAVVSCAPGRVLAFYSDDPSSNPAEDCSFSAECCLKRTKINKKRKNSGKVGTGKHAHLLLRWPEFDSHRSLKYSLNML